MQLDERLQAFFLLGERINSIDDDAFNILLSTILNENPWFTKDNVKRALTGVSRLLDKTAVSDWISKYKIDDHVQPRTIALILAGNIPAVGFHDVLCVLISGHNAMIKFSSKDKTLMTFILDQLIQIEPRFTSNITFTDQLKNFDAAIATGSDNSARYFEYYFSKYPSIIRKNRTSVAIINGNETSHDIERLGEDIFSYFGLGCRNVSKIFVPHDYKVANLFSHWKKYDTIINHHKYANNYDYQKAILMVNKTPFLDNGFVLLTESKKLVSPLAVLFYEKYNSATDLRAKLTGVADKIQCIVSNNGTGTVQFGQAQFPGPADYADHVDTMRFLLNL